MVEVDMVEVDMVEVDFIKANYLRNDLNNPNFCIILEKFIDSLVLFAQYIVPPTVGSTHIIHKKNSRDVKFDMYVFSIEEFNYSMHEILELLKVIIIALNKVFIYRDIDNLMNFIKNLKDFLLFLVTKNIFLNLDKLSMSICTKYKKDISIIKKIKNVKYYIFRIVNITCDITAIFIPPVLVIKEVISVTEKRGDSLLDKQIDEIEQSSTKLDSIVKQLLDIQLRGQIISNINTPNILTCLVDKQATKLIRMIENLSTEYLELLHLTLTLKNEIGIYKDKKNNVFLSFLQKLIK